MKRTLDQVEALEAPALSIWNARKENLPQVTTTTTTTCSQTDIVLDSGNASMEKSVKKYRLNAKNFFLTFPQCTEEKKIVLQRLMSSSLKEKVQWCMISQECHQDGEKHLHLGICFNVKLNIRKPDFFDFLCEKHGNYQTMRSVKASLTYLQKEDKEPLIYGEVPTFSEESKVAKSSKIAEMVRSGSCLEDIEAEDPGYFMLNMKKIMEYQSYVSSNIIRKSLKSLVLPLVYIGQKLDTQAVVGWLNTNLLCSRPFKSLQIFIHGPPNYLKSSLIECLRKYLMVYQMPLQEDFYDFYFDEKFDLVVLDEFRGQKTIQFLNLWLQGGEMTIRKKGSQYIKRKNLPMIILSNYCLDECYKDVNKINTLRTRLLEISLSDPIDIDNIKFE